MLIHLTIFRLSTRWGRRWTTCSRDECADFAKIETAVDFAKIETAADFAKIETAVDCANVEKEDLQVDNLTTTNV